MLIVENPEAHLQPSGQSAMGAFLAQTAGDDVQVVVETHSDHVINGIRRVIADRTSNLAAHDTAIHFFEAAGEEVAVKTIDVMETGQLSVWPPGFFDQGQRDLAQLARAQRRTS
jgi:predicted ATPase